jgi:hypothetical protein
MKLAESISSVSPEMPDILQGELFDFGPSIYRQFTAFHKKYPQVYLLFEKFALQLIKAGKIKLGSKMIIERIRWEIATGSQDDDGFKINNNFTAYYSREFAKKHPEYEEYFDFRTIRRI